MRKRRTTHQVAQVLRDVDRDLAKGLTIADVLPLPNGYERVASGRREKTPHPPFGQPLL
jgi:hypothetical protein